MATIENGFETTSEPETSDASRSDSERQRGRTKGWLGWLIGTPHKSTFRQVYVVENQDWLAPKSDLSDDEAYDAIIDLYNTVNDEQYKAAIEDLQNAQPPESSGSEEPSV